VGAKSSSCGSEGIGPSGASTKLGTALKRHRAVPDPQVRGGDPNRTVPGEGGSAAEKASEDDPHAPLPDQVPGRRPSSPETRLLGRLAEALIPMLNLRIIFGQFRGPWTPLASECPFRIPKDTIGIISEVRTLSARVQEWSGASADAGDSSTGVGSEPRTVFRTLKQWPRAARGFAVRSPR
jgi:hypothetical protein